MKFTKVFSVIFHIVTVVNESYGLEVLDLDFPKGFLIGSASSAYQVEGAWNHSGKSESNWDFYTHNYPNRIADKSSADVSSDAYNKFEEDINEMKKIGMQFYRFSISWTRILPTGYSDDVSSEGLQYYHNLIDELEKHEIIPMITIYHWDHPQKFEEEFGGWLSEKMAHAYADYAKIIFKEFAPRVKIFATINEPFIFCDSAYTTGTYPHIIEQNTTGWGSYHCIQNILKGHALAYHLYDEEYREKYNGKIGIVMPIMYNFPKNENDEESTDIAFEFQVGMTTHPIYSKEGDYPEIVKERIAKRSKAQGSEKSRMPELSEYWINYIRGTADYFGLNHYTSDLVEPLPESDILNWPTDEGLLHTRDPNWPTAQSPWLKIVPEGFGAVLRKIKEKYDNPPVYVMENGVSDGNGTNDNMRIDYMRSYMKEMLIAMKRDGCDVQAYSVWSFLDSFEWDAGFTHKFGLYEVDFNDSNRKRTPKKSVSWLTEVIRARKLL